MWPASNSCLDVFYSIVDDHLQIFLLSVTNQLEKLESITHNSIIKLSIIKNFKVDNISYIVIRGLVDGHAEIKKGY